MEVSGYCTIKPNATTGVGENIQSFLGKDCRVMDFACDGGVLVINAEATSMAIFDKEDVLRKFECKVYNDVLCPPEMDMLQQMLYSIKVTTRKGGYNNLLKNMVIQISLMKGKLTDSFLFSKEYCQICGKPPEPNLTLCFEHILCNTPKPPKPPDDRILPEGGPIKPPKNYR